MTEIQPNTQITPETVRVPFSATNDMVQRINAWADDPSMDGGAIYDAIIGHYAAPYSHRPAASSPSAVGVGEPLDIYRCDQCNGEGFIYPNGIGDGHNHREVCPTCKGAGGYHPGDIETPTPAPSADHIGGATEMIDWQAVGPKLVEAGYAFIDSELGAEWRSCTDSRVRARMGKSARAEGLIAFRAALADAQPQSNGE